MDGGSGYGRASDVSEGWRCPPALSGSRAPAVAANKPGAARVTRRCGAGARWRSCGRDVASRRTFQYRWWYHYVVPSVAKIVAAMRANPRNIRFDDLAKVCEHHFGPPRPSGGSHRVFKTPWPGDPRVNIQNDQGMAKAYQVRQVLDAIEKKEAGS